MAENNMDLMAWLRKQLADVALPDRTAATWRGREFFGYPATWHSEDWA